MRRSVYVAPTGSTSNYSRSVYGRGRDLPLPVKEADPLSSLEAIVMFMSEQPKVCHPVQTIEQGPMDSVLFVTNI